MRRPSGTTRSAPRLILVRHGRAVAGWGDDLDPGLDDVGTAQATAVADALGALGPLPLYTSPLRRARETAAALERRWGVTAIVDPALGEIPSPDLTMAERRPWIEQVLAASWPDLSDDLRSWRAGVIDAFTAVAADGGPLAVAVTHFVAINVIAGAATGDDRVACRMVGNCSTTTVEFAGNGAVQLVDTDVPADTTDAGPLVVQ